MFTKVLLLIIIISLTNTKEHLGARKSIIPRHASEKGVLFDVTTPTEGLYKRSHLGETFDSGVFHKLENFLLKKVDDLGLNSKKSDIEDQKEVETVAESVEATPLTSEVKQGVKDSAKEEIEKVVKNFINVEKKKSAVSKKNEASGKNVDAKKEKDNKNVAANAKEKLSEKSKKEAEEKSERNEAKRAKKDDVTGKNRPAKFKISESVKKDKSFPDSAMKRDQTATDEDDEYGSSRSNPALSCTDLFTKFPNLPSGTYWVQSADRKEKMMVMCENPIDKKEGDCLDCDHDEDGKGPGNS